MTQRIDDLPTPALLLDVDRAEVNLTGMAERAKRLGVTLRPHIKTHKCVEIAERQRELGAQGITVSTLYEARTFADHGFDDLTWAVPVAASRLPEARDLAERTRLGVRIRLGLVVDSETALDALERTGFPYRVWLKVDCGYHRAGVDPGSPASVALARRLSTSAAVTFAGILTHSGHAYSARSQKKLAAVAEQERRVMVEFATRLREAGITVPAVSVGSTPAMSAVKRLDGVDEVRPGNYVFYDYSQCVRGCCTPADCALTVLASVVSSQPGAEHSVVDAGALALSKDLGVERARPRTMGEIFAEYDAGRLHSDLRLISLSQEHGILRGSLPVGSRVRILPNHSCLTAAHFDEYHVVRGDRVVDRWKIWRGR